MTTTLKTPSSGHARLRDRAVTHVAAAGAAAAIEALDVAYLGKKGELTIVLRGIGQLPAEDRPRVGSIANEVRAAIDEALAGRRAVLGASALEARLEAEVVDVTTSGRRPPRGRLHP